MNDVDFSTMLWYTELSVQNREVNVMPRAKKDGRCLNCIIERSIYDQFERYCENVGQTKTTALERILKQFLAGYDAQNDTHVEEYTND